MKQLDILGKLFGSMTRVKLLKFFLLNGEPFAVVEIAKRLKVSPNALRSEFGLLEKIGCIKSKTVLVEGARKKKRVKGYVAQSDFALREPLYTLVVESGGMHIPDVTNRFSRVGKIKLFIVSGIFIHDPERVTDILIVGDNLNRSKIEREIKTLESEIGKELRYALFDTNEFMYRLNMYDKLLRDVLDYPHEKVINKMDHPELRG